jgi:hypothetical protein
MIDFLFIELYIKKKYNQKVEEYFNIHKMSVSSWRKSNQIPERRLIIQDILDIQLILKRD